MNDVVFGAQLEMALLAYLDALAAASTLEAALAVVTEQAASWLRTDRASLRILDASRTRLLLAARAGVALHEVSDFEVGEGLAGWVVAHNQPILSGWAPDDPRFSSRPGVPSALGSFVGVPLADLDGCFGVLASTRPERDAFDPADARRLALLAKVAAPLLSVHRLRRLAQTDPLTMVPNRHALEHLLPSRSGQSVAAAMIDIDHFKRVNDSHGHAVGDRVLRDIAREIRATIRTDDHVVRMGGEEFLVLLPLASARAAAEVADDIRANVASRVRVHGAGVSLSVGVAVRLPDEPREELLRRADEALYEAKRLGRDRVVLAVTL